MNPVLHSLLSHRRPLAHPDLPFVLFYSEKSGCTATVKWFFFHCGLLQTALAHHPWVHEYEHQVFKAQADYPHLLERLVLQEPRALIKFTRNPYRRAVSSFLLLFERSSVENPDHRIHRRWAEMRQTIHQRNAPDLPISFRQFLHYLDRRGVGLQGNDPHFAQQIHPSEAVLPVEHFDLQDMAGHLRRLEARFGLAACPLELLSSGHHQAYGGQSAGSWADLALTETSLFDHQPPDFRSFYDPDAAELVRRIYHADFDRYGYPDALARA